MRLKHDAGWNIPIDDPFFPSLPAIYRNVRFQMVTFFADPGAVRQFLPEPLEADPTGMCVAAGIEIPDCPNYGPINESALQVQCRFRERTGFLCTHVFHDGPAGIAAGREVYGTPKVFADVRISHQGTHMRTDSHYRNASVLEIVSDTPQPVEAGDLPDLKPAWRLKVIPRADRPEPAIKQLIDCSRVVQDARVHVVRRGIGRIVLGKSGGCDLTSLTPQRYGDCFYFEMSYQEGFAEIEYDYLAGS